MKWMLPVLISLWVTPWMQAQDCHCRAQFDFVRAYMEENSPAYQRLRRDARAHKQYLRAVSKLEKESGKEVLVDRCSRYMETYISLLKDHHSSIGFSIARLPVDASSVHQVDSFKATPAYRGVPRLPVDTTALLGKLSDKPQSDIEGLWTNGGSLSIGVMRKGKHKYIGVVMRPTRFLEPGQVLLELMPRPDGRYTCIYRLGLMAFTFQELHTTVNVRDGAIPELGFFKAGYAPPATKPPYAFTSLDATTNYLSLRSFDHSLIPELDSLFEAIGPELSAKPDLIIDLRDNGGGDERAYLHLLPYIISGPLALDTVQVWVSPANLRLYATSGRNPALTERMRQARPYTFIPLTESPEYTWSPGEPTAYPRRIVMLFNRHTASSAEGLIVYGLQSDKVMTAGENSGGYLGYGNVMDVPVPCGKFTLSTTTTMYARNAQYEFVGIAPQHRLAEQTDWLKAARQLLSSP